MSNNTLMINQTHSESYRRQSLAINRTHFEIAKRKVSPSLLSYAENRFRLERNSSGRIGAFSSGKRIVKLSGVAVGIDYYTIIYEITGAHISATFHAKESRRSPSIFASEGETAAVFTRRQRNDNSRNQKRLFCGKRASNFT